MARPRRERARGFAARPGGSILPSVLAGTIEPRGAAVLAAVLSLSGCARCVEVYNMVVTPLRDRYLLGDTPRTLLAPLSLTDRQILAQGRRLVPVGGTDSHTGYLRATTFVRAAARTEPAIRDALAAGRTCVRSPEACTFEVHVPGGEWQPIGASLPAPSLLEARAHGGPVEVLVNGEAAASGADDEILQVPLGRPGCSVVRARVGEGYSAPIYAGCPFGP